MTDADSDLLAVGATLLVGDVATRVAGRKGTDDHVILRLDLASDRDGAESLRGQELLVDASPELDDDEYLAADLVGSVASDGDRRLGTVVALLALPSCEALELDTGQLIPMVRDAIRSIDVGAKRIDVDSEFLGAA